MPGSDGIYGCVLLTVVQSAREAMDVPYVGLVEVIDNLTPVVLAVVTLALAEVSVSMERCHMGALEATSPHQPPFAHVC